MNIQLTDKQLKSLQAKAKTETDRDIYYISFNGQEIRINGDWSIQRGNKTINQEIIAAIEEYCTKRNIEWEYNSTYSAWCD